MQGKIHETHIILTKFMQRANSDTSGRGFPSGPFQGRWVTAAEMILVGPGIAVDEYHMKVSSGISPKISRKVLMKLSKLAVSAGE